MLSLVDEKGERPGRMRERLTCSHRWYLLFRRDVPSSHTCSLRQPLRGPPLRSGHGSQGERPVAGRARPWLRARYARLCARTTRTPPATGLAAMVASLRARGPLGNHVRRLAPAYSFHKERIMNNLETIESQEQSFTAMVCEQAALFGATPGPRRVRQPTRMGRERIHIGRRTGLPRPRTGSARRDTACGRASEPPLGLRQHPRRTDTTPRPRRRQAHPRHT